MPPFVLWAATALTVEGWARDVRVEIDGAGRIAAVAAGVPRDPAAGRAPILLPAPGNVHSHTFQRAMAGLSERRSSAANGDSFWTWRDVMYRFVERLTPEDVEAIAALVFVEMLEAGYAAVGEFHYLHHAPGGAPYDDPAELSRRVFAAAAETGIGLTHLPVLYAHGGLSGEPLTGGQQRFGCDPERFARLRESAAAGLADLPADARLGVAPHSLRAVEPDELRFAVDLAPAAPLHLHIAEQTAEVAAVEAAYGRRPVEWLLDEFDVDERWCLIHATQMTAAETERLARRGAVAGLCPITESNLGDGTFDGRRFLTVGGAFGVGSDSNVRIGLVEELRTLEYSQRLRDRARAVLVAGERSVGRTLYEAVCRGGASALARDAGAIETGRLADLVALREGPIALAGLDGDALLDAWIFAADDGLVEQVWSAGRHVVVDGLHVRRTPVEARAAAVLARLRAEL